MISNSCNTVGYSVKQSVNWLISPQQQSGFGIQLFRPHITLDEQGRLNTINHFDWVVDVENKMHKGNKVEIIRKALRTVLRVTGIEEGYFYADDVNTETLQIKDEDGRDGELHGAAESVKALIPLGDVKILLPDFQKELK